MAMNSAKVGFESMRSGTRHNHDIKDIIERCFMDKPALYRIRVRGELSPKWSDRLGNMSISVERPEKNGPVTTLVGRLRDQAALAGVMSTLFELHMAVLSLECLDEPET
jgi:hypothetical protein